MQDKSAPRQFALSYLRAFVTLLVVAHHAAIAYRSTKPPSHPFTQQPLLWSAFPVSDAGGSPVFDLLVGWNDIFFMALMFLVSGLFVWPSLRRHGAGPYVKRRLLRLGVPFALTAGVLAPLAYYPAYLQLGGEARVSSYASAWLALGEWPAGPAWFLWLLLVFDCVLALCFVAAPRAVEALARSVRALSNRPALLFLALATLSLAVYVPMAIEFGADRWWSWGPFFVQASRVMNYFVYFALGVCLGAFGTEIAILERAGPLTRRWWLWGLMMVAAFAAEAALVRTGATTGAKILFPVSCAASSFFVIAAVIRFARQSQWADYLSANAYGIYVVHYVFVIWLQYAALRWTMPVVVKGVAVFDVALGLSWTVSALLRQSKTIAQVV
jgi:peptidoglycan/LPS O-acetylase OafA/YrhL